MFVPIIYVRLDMVFEPVLWCLTVVWALCCIRTKFNMQVIMRAKPHAWGNPLTDQIRRSKVHNHDQKKREKIWKLMVCYEFSAKNMIFNQNNLIFRIAEIRRATSGNSHPDYVWRKFNQSSPLTRHEHLFRLMRSGE